VLYLGWNLDREKEHYSEFGWDEYLGWNLDREREHYSDFGWDECLVRYLERQREYHSDFGWDEYLVLYLERQREHDSEIGWVHDWEDYLGNLMASRLERDLRKEYWKEVHYWLEQTTEKH
jgi:hypothetical protein